ncbi:uncharacterized protein LOC141647750 [Silene latifolia]|uniref:uncharacterized protein LOC141647750 n=1 Tax=Silene latifolia TaxID=37657 RepID=UPI003D77A588
MGFNSVYQTLKDLFPQVDTRLLKAVAIEHSKDPDAAVEYIITDVLPYTSDKPDSPASVVEDEGKTADTCNASSTVGSNSENVGTASILLNDGHNLEDDSALSFYDANDSQPLVNLEGVSSVPLRDIETDRHVNMTVNALLPSVTAKDDEADVSPGNVQNMQTEHSDGISSSDFEQAPVSDSLKKQPYDCNSLECVVSTECAFEDQMPGALSWNSHPEANSNSTSTHANEKDIDAFLDSEFVLEFPETDAVAAESETSLSTIVTQSGQICRVNLLEDIIDEAKNYKNVVGSAMESVVKLMEEVEHQENEAEKAKAAAARGGLDIIEKVEEIKKMLIHAKEANDMHAGEVYGEKSILATEVKELQSRLIGLSDEKDKSLLVLDEMRKNLAERLAIAEEQKRASEKEMFEKQAIALGALAEQEVIMEKVVQDSKLLQQEAEENAKLRDFLMEKGQVLDVLQGEISVICQNVKSLKENFDNRVSLSTSLSNSSVKSTGSLKSMTSLKSITSLNRTASLRSTLSQNSSFSDVTVFIGESPKRILSDECQSPRSDGEKFVSSYEARAQKPLLDEDWELCDMI